MFLSPTWKHEDKKHIKPILSDVVQRPVKPAFWAEVKKSLKLLKNTVLRTVPGSQADELTGQQWHFMNFTKTQFALAAPWQRNTQLTHGTATDEHYLTSYTTAHMRARAHAHTHCQNCLNSFRSCNFTANSIIFKIWKVQEPRFKQFHVKKSKHNWKTSGFCIYT
jgi:hypothetical protein